MSDKNAQAIISSLFVKIELPNFPDPLLDEKGRLWLKLIRLNFPNVKVLMQTIFKEEEKLLNAIMAGADGYILKIIPKENFDLTKREQEILVFLVQGLRYKMIAEKYSISYVTVNTHISHIYEKMHVQSNAETVAKAIENNL